jgi:hypothetical protein
MPPDKKTIKLLLAHFDKMCEEEHNAKTVKKTAENQLKRYLVNHGFADCVELRFDLIQKLL